MRIHSVKRLIKVLLFYSPLTGLLLTACSPMTLQQQQGPLTTYRLQAPQDDQLRQIKDAAPCLTLLVNSMRAHPGFTSSRIAYVKKEYQLDYFAHHQWADTPANMLTSIITQSLESGHLFRAVVESPAAVTADLRLDSELLHFQQVFSDGSSDVELELRMILVNQQNRSVIASQTFTFTEVASENTPYGAVMAANRIVARLLPELDKFIGSAIVDRAKACE